VCITHLLCFSSVKDSLHYANERVQPRGVSKVALCATSLILPSAVSKRQVTAFSLVNNQKSGVSDLATTGKVPLCAPFCNRCARLGNVGSTSRENTILKIYESKTNSPRILRVMCNFTFTCISERMLKYEWECC